MNAPVEPEIYKGEISEMVIGIIQVYIPIQAPWITLIMIKLGNYWMKSKAPDMIARALINRINLRLVNK